MGELTIAISDPVYRDLAVGEDVDVVLRPEIIKVDRREGSAEAVVLQSAYLGESVEYILEYLGQKISAKETDPTMQSWSMVRVGQLNLLYCCVRYAADVHIHLIDLRSDLQP